MKRYLIIFFTLFFCSLIIAQNKSIHQEQAEHYNSLDNDNASWYEQNTLAAAPPLQEKAACNLNKIVYGWHPYWSGSAYLNYDWSLLSHFSFFSYEVDPATGDPLTTHGWSTSTAVDAALASGNTKVTLCVTLFGGTNLTTFLTNDIAKQTLITNLINTVQARGAHGVNIDFEGLGSSQRTNFANFMVDLTNQMHTAIPNSEVSTVLYSVDWNNVFDFAIMDPVVDHFVIMGYGYYYSGSATAGPTDPLYHFGSTYNFTLSKTITTFLDAGCSANKLVMGLPYYGYEYPTSTTAIPGATTGSGTARTYAYVKNNSTGFYTTANHQFEQDSYTDVYVFNNGGTRQCFITEEYGFRKRLDHINKTGIAGIGIWALGYDDGYSNYWNGINDYLTDCYESPCSDTLHDFGGPTKNYYNNEDYTWTIAPPNSLSIDVTFSSFDVELDYDYLYIYDGPTIAAPQIAGSPFTGTTIPSNFTSTAGELTFRFTSDGATVTPGFVATYSCNQDLVAPTTSVATTGTWQTTDFNASFTDIDNILVEESFYQVADFDGTEWRSNSDFGFFNDEFEQSTLHADWISQTGTWNSTSTDLQQTDELIGNSNIYANVTQEAFNTYVYNWQGQINGTGTNRRAGMHIFCDDPTLPNRGNSYFVYWRVDNNKCQIYEVNADVWTLLTDDTVTINPNTTYDFKIIYNPVTGNIKTYLDNVLSSEFTDSTPLTIGNSISLRTGDCLGIYDNIRVYKSRTNNELISIGSAASEIRYQNPNSITSSGRIASLNIDGNDNWSVVFEKLENIDWTPPNDVAVEDGISADIDTFYVSTEISSNWSSSIDTHSDVVEYQYAIGTTPGGTDIVNWTTNGVSTSKTHTGLSLTYGVLYYVSIKSINGAGLESNIISSDGNLLLDPTNINEFTFNSSVYPNPTTGKLFLRFNTTQIDNLTILLYSTSGKLIKTFPQKAIATGKSIVELDLNSIGISKGIYLLKIIGNNNSSTLPFVYQNSN